MLLRKILVVIEEKHGFLLLYGVRIFEDFFLRTLKFVNFLIISGKIDDKILSVARALLKTGKLPVYPFRKIILYRGPQRNF